MMNVVIKETGKQELLELVGRNGADSAIDLIGNYDGLGNEDHQFAYDNDNDVYVCNQETFDWWKRVLRDQQELENRISDLCEQYSSDAVYEAIGNSGECDLEDQSAAINAALDQVFGDNSGK